MCLSNMFKFQLFVVFVMALIRKVEFEGSDILLHLKILKEEYTLLKEGKHLLLIPVDPNSLDEELTTGALGTSSRVMLPKRMLERHGVAELPKKAHSKFFNVDGRKFLVVDLSVSQPGVPKFLEG